MTKTHGDGCHIGDVFQVLGKSHVLDMLYVAVTKDGPTRFGDWQQELELSPNTLSSRLKLLVEIGLLERQAFAEIPPRVEYRVTQSARDFQGVFEAIAAWAAKHSFKQVAATT